MMHTLSSLSSGKSKSTFHLISHKHTYKSSSIKTWGKSLVVQWLGEWVVSTKSLWLMRQQMVFKVDK